MSIAILLVTHGQIGHSLLKTAQYILKNPIVVPIMSLPITEQDMSVSRLAVKIQDYCDQLNQGDGVLLLSDLVGATPYNGVKTAIAQHHNHYPLHTVTGLNLGMLLKAINEISLETVDDMQILEQKVEKGGRRSIFVPT